MSSTGPPQPTCTDTGNGFRAATVDEVDQAPRQLPLFGAADIGAHVATPKRRLRAERVESHGMTTGRAREHPAERQSTNA